MEGFRKQSHYRMLMPCAPTDGLPRKVWPMDQSLHEGTNEVSQITISQTLEEMQDMKNFFWKRSEPACGRAHRGLGNTNAERWANIDMVARGGPRVLYDVMSADRENENLACVCVPESESQKYGKLETRSTASSR